MEHVDGRLVFDRVDHKLDVLNLALLANDLLDPNELKWLVGLLWIIITFQVALRNVVLLRFHTWIFFILKIYDVKVNCH